jgi:hypothetical protein
MFLLTGQMYNLYTMSSSFYVPMDEGSLGVHEVKLVVKAGPRLGDGGGVGQHADGPLDLGQVAAWHRRGRLVVDTDLQTEGASCDTELNR